MRTRKAFWYGSAVCSKVIRRFIGYSELSLVNDKYKNITFSPITLPCGFIRTKVISKRK